MASLIHDRIECQQLSAEEIYLAKLIFGDVQITGVTEDFDNIGDNEIPSSTAFKRYVNDIMSELRRLSDTIADFHFAPLISDPIVPPAFLAKYWTPINFFFNSGTAHFVSPNQSTTATCTLESDAFTKVGTYMAVVDVSSLPSGTIDVIASGTIIGSIDSPGKYQYQFNVDNVNLATLRLRVSGVGAGQTVSVLSAAISYIKNSLDDFLEYKIDEIASGTTGLVSTDELTEAIDAAKVELKAYIDDRISSLSTTIATHINRRDNPHNVKLSQVQRDVDIYSLCDTTIMLGNYIPNKFAAADGSELIIADYPDFYDQAKQRGIVISRTIYNQRIAADGACYSCGYDDGDSTIKLPTTNEPIAIKVEN